MKKIIIFLILFVLTWTTEAQIKSKNVNINRPLQKGDLDGYATEIFCYGIFGETATIDDTLFVSMYPEGNDTTGDGTISAPYHTLGKALQEVPIFIADARIIIKIDSGSFNYTRADRQEIATKRFLGKYGQLIIWGTFDTLPMAGITYTQRIDSPFVFDIAGTTFTANEWQYGFGTGYIHVVSIDGERNAAITANGTDWIEVSSPTNFKSGSYPQWNFLVKSWTTFDMSDFKTPATDPVAFDFNQPPGEPSILFSDIKFINYNVLQFHSPVLLSRCFFSENNKRMRLYENIETIRFDGVICLGGGNIQGKIDLKGCYFTHSSARVFTIGKGGFGRVYGTVFEGNATNEIIRTDRQGAASFQEVKFKNGKQVFNLKGRTWMTYKRLLSIENCDYLAYCITDGGTSFHAEDTTDLVTRFDLNIGYLDPAGFTKAVDPGTGYMIRVPGLYPEYEGDLEETLTDNSTTDFVVGDSLQNKSITIEYTATRSTSIEKNTVHIINKKSSVSVAEETLVGDDIGLSFAVQYDGAGLIELRATLTSTGNDADFQYRVRRIQYY